MSRIGRAPITVPAGVTVEIAEGNVVTVTGKLGTLQRTLSTRMTIAKEGDTIVVSRPSDDRFDRAAHGLTRTLIANMIIGVSEGYQKKLEMEGVGYKVADWNKSQLNIAIGYSHPVIVDAPAGIEFDVPEKSGTKIVVKGIDKQLVGAIAADIRAIREPEPYHGKGIRYENEYVRRKEGKAGKK